MRPHYGRLRVLELLAQSLLQTETFYGSTLKTMFRIGPYVFVYTILVHLRTAEVDSHPPSANGVAHRIVQSIKRILAKLTKLVNNLVDHWVRMLRAASQAYVNKMNFATCVFANHLLFGL